MPIEYIKSEPPYKELQELADTLKKKYLTVSDLQIAYPYDAATGWQNFNTAKIIWWASPLRK